LTAATVGSISDVMSLSLLLALAGVLALQRRDAFLSSKGVTMAKRDMRIIALGGCGGMGQFAVRTALTFDFVKEIVVADRNWERARTFAHKCGPKAVPLELDVQDKDALASALRGTDAALATVGPYYRFGMPILRAAIKAGCNYIDINDDWEPTLEMLELDEEARKAGITAIIGMGASPGLSNMLAVEAIRLLDDVDTVITGWGSPGGAESDSMPPPGEGGSFGAATDHWLHQLTGEIRLWRGGKYADVRPLEAVEVDYPGVGKGTTYTVGHPEPVTLPRYFSSIRDSCNVMNFPGTTIATLRWLAGRVDRGEVSLADAIDWLNKLENEGAEELLANPPAGLIEELMSADQSPPVLPALFGWAKGRSKGKPASAGATISSAPPGSMGAMTGIPMAIGLRMLAEGRIERRGVFAPEAVIDPDVFFDELAPFCEPKAASGRELVVTSISS